MSVREKTKTRPTTYTTGDCARMLEVAMRTVAKWFDSGRLKGYHIPGSNDRRIPREALITFLKENGLPVPAELRDGRTISYGLSTGEVEFVNEAYGDPIAFGAAIAAAPVFAAIVGDADGLTLARSAALAVRNLHLGATVVLVVSEDAVVEPIEGVRVVKRPVAWAALHAELFRTKAAVA